MNKTYPLVALITGCGKENGIGAAIARRLAGDGFVVAVSDVASAGLDNDNKVVCDESGWQGLETLVEQIEANGGTALSMNGDVSKEDEAAAIVQRTVEAHGRLDVLVNNAGAPLGSSGRHR